MRFRILVNAGHILAYVYRRGRMVQARGSGRVRVLVLAAAALLSVASASSSSSSSGGGGGAQIPAKGTMPAGASWEGKWTTTFGPVDVVNMNGADGFDYAGAYIYQSQGTTVNGLFGGKVEGNWFVLKWVEKRPQGNTTGFAVWAMNGDGGSFTGTWGSGESANNGGRWEGRRDDPNRAPVPLPN
jgi:hypothetical protein